MLDHFILHFTRYEIWRLLFQTTLNLTVLGGHLRLSSFGLVDPAGFYHHLALALLSLWKWRRCYHVRFNLDWIWMHWYFSFNEVLTRKIWFICFSFDLVHTWKSIVYSLPLDWFCCWRWSLCRHSLELTWVWTTAFGRDATLLIWISHQLWFSIVESSSASSISIFINLDSSNFWLIIIWTMCPDKPRIENILTDIFGTVALFYSVVWHHIVSRLWLGWTLEDTACFVRLILWWILIEYPVNSISSWSEVSHWIWITWVETAGIKHVQTFPAHFLLQLNASIVSLVLLDNLLGELSWWLEWYGVVIIVGRQCLLNSMLK